MSNLNDWTVTGKNGVSHQVLPATNKPEMNWKVRYGKNGWKYFPSKESVRKHYGASEK